MLRCQRQDWAKRRIKLNINRGKLVRVYTSICMYTITNTHTNPLLLLLIHWDSSCFLPSRIFSDIGCCWCKTFFTQHRNKIDLWLNALFYYYLYSIPMGTLFLAITVAKRPTHDLFVNAPLIQTSHVVHIMESEPRRFNAATPSSPYAGRGEPWQQGHNRGPFKAGRLVLGWEYKQVDVFTWFRAVRGGHNSMFSIRLHEVSLTAQIYRCDPDFTHSGPYFFCLVPSLNPSLGVKRRAGVDEKRGLFCLI